MPAPPKKPAAPKVPKAPKVAPPAGGKEEKRVRKTFAVEPWSGHGEGERVVIYGESGMGKTTLAALLADPVFVGVDPGGRKLRPNGKPLKHLPVKDFLDLRDALAQASLLSKGQTLVIDTFTRVESDWTIPQILATVKSDNNKTVKYIERYGYGKGFSFVLDHTRMLLSDLDRVAAQGVNVVLLCQEAAVTAANAEGTDYLQNGPKLTHTKQASSRKEICEWADHVFRIGYLETTVQANADDRVGKVSGEDTVRVVYTTPARHFIAKTRPINGETLPEVVSFESPEDPSLWIHMFGASA